MFRLAVIVAVVAAAVVTANPAPAELSFREAVLKDASGNAFIDGILAKVNEKLPKRMSIADVGTFLHLKDCFIAGLDGGIHRDGDASKSFANMSIVVTTGIKIGLVGAQCDWSFVLNDGTIGGDVKSVAVHMSVAVPMSTSKNIKLQEFNMRELGDLDLILTGMGALDEPMRKLVHAIVDGPLKEVLIFEMDQKLPALIQTELDNIHI